MSRRPKKVKSTKEVYNTEAHNKIFIRPKLVPKNQSQADYIRMMAEKEIVFCGGPAGTGKAQPLFCNVLTPEGFKPLKEIKVGDTVITPKNTLAKVIGEFPQGKKPVYKVTFHDGSFTLCCKEHLWQVRNNYSENNAWPKILDAETIKNKHEKAKKSYLYVETVQPINFEEKQLDISPYLLGVLLGDGGISSGTITLTTISKFIIKKIRSLLTEELKAKKLKSSKYGYQIVNKVKKGGQKNSLKEKLKKLKLMGLKSYEKFIPQEYLTASISQRLELLRGLLDTDGTVCKNGRTIYYTTSEKLKDGVIDIVNSLGGVCKVREKNPTFTYKGVKKSGKKCYVVTINLNNNICPFSLPRKVKRITPRTKYFPRRLFKSFEYFGEEECKCILIDDKDHLYITDHYIVTHNTFISTIYGLLKVLEGDFQKLVLIRPAVTSEEIGLLPGGISEKVEPFMEPVLAIIDKFLQKDEFTKLQKEGRIEIRSLAYLRGLTLDNSFIIIDEAENCNKKQLMLIVTRIGQNSKLIIEGDENQSDLKKGETLAFARHLEIFEDYCNQIGVFRFTEVDIVRNKIIGVYLKALKDKYGTDSADIKSRK